MRACVYATLRALVVGGASAGKEPCGEVSVAYAPWCAAGQGRARTSVGPANGGWQESERGSGFGDGEDDSTGFDLTLEGVEGTLRARRSIQYREPQHTRATARTGQLYSGCDDPAGIYAIGQGGELGAEGVELLGGGTDDCTTELQETAQLYVDI